MVARLRVVIIRLISCGLCYSALFANAINLPNVVRDFHSINGNLVNWHVFFFFFFTYKQDGLYYLKWWYDTNIEPVFFFFLLFIFIRALWVYAHIEILYRNASFFNADDMLQSFYLVIVGLIAIICLLWEARQKAKITYIFNSLIMRLMAFDNVCVHFQTRKWKWFVTVSSSSICCSHFFFLDFHTDMLVWKYDAETWTRKRRKCKKIKHVWNMDA